MAQYYYSPNELYHYGILGMKWGVRRYQNADGTLTAAGKKRYTSEKIQKAAIEVHSQLTAKGNRRMSKEFVRESAKKKIGVVSKADMENGNDDVRKAMDRKRADTTATAEVVSGASVLGSAGALTAISNTAAKASSMHWLAYLKTANDMGVDVLGANGPTVKFISGMARSTLPMWAIAATSPTLVTAAKIMSIGVPVAATAIAGYKAYKSNKVAKLISDMNDKNIEEMTPALSDKDRKAIEDKLKGG